MVDAVDLLVVEAEARTGGGSEVEHGHMAVGVADLVRVRVRLRVRGMVRVRVRVRVSCGHRSRRPSGRRPRPRCVRCHGERRSHRPRPPPHGTPP